MKKLLALLLAVALVFGFGYTVANFAIETPKLMVADPGYPPPEPPSKWPPVVNSIPIPKI